MRSQKCEKIYQICGVVAFCAFCVLMANCTMFGTGNYLHALGVSVLGVTVVVSSVFSVPIMLRDFKQIMKDLYLWILIAYAVWNVVGVVVGLRNGNSFDAISADVNAVIYFVLFPVILSILTSEKRIHTLMRVMMYCSLAISILSCVLLWTYLFSYETFRKLVDICNYGNFLNFTNISHTIPRVLFFSSPFQLCGCAFSIYFVVREKRVSVKYVLPLGLGLFCILLTYTRALYLAAFVAAVVVVVLFMLNIPVAQWKKLWLSILVGVLVCVLVVAGFSKAGETDYFGYGLERVFTGIELPSVESDPVEAAPNSTVPNYLPGEDGSYNEESFLNATVQSDLFRGQLQEELLAMIAEAPITGKGLGAQLPRSRINAEYSFLDLCAKKGIVGLVLYLLPMVLMVLSILINTWKKEPLLMSCAWCAVLIGFMTFSIYQPYMNNAPCALLYCSALCVHSAERKLSRERKTKE